MLAPERGWLDLDENDSTLLHFQIAWLQSLPSLLISLDNKYPACSKAILQLQLCVGRTAPLNSPLSREFDNMQYALKDFFSSQIDEGICYGPFIRLGADLQELTMCCLYYFSTMGSQLLQSIVSCCLCDDLEPCIVLRILEILQSAFRAGHIEVAEYASFIVTVLSRFQVHPENIYHDVVYEGKSNRRIFKSITSVICSCFSQLGDDYLVLEMLENIIVDQIRGNTSLDNKCAFLRLLVVLDSNPTRLSDQSIIYISHVLPQYLIDVVSEGEKHCQEELTSVAIAKRQQYYLLPAFCLFQKSKRLLNLVLDMCVTWVTDINSSFSLRHPSADHSTKLCAIVSLLLNMHKDEKIRQVVLSFKIKIENQIHNLLNMQSSEGINLTLEEMNKIQSARDRLADIVDTEMGGC